jgi:two-component sensor histidine kinase
MMIDLGTRPVSIAASEPAPVPRHSMPFGLSVTNRLCVVAGLVHIQATTIGSNLAGPQQTDIRHWLEKTGRRMDAVVGLHRSAAGSADGSVRLASYFRAICNAALSCSTRPEAMTLHLAVEPDCQIRAERALSMGLILGELATNAIRFAHPTGVHGILEVKCARDGAAANIDLTVTDDGIGLPEHFDPLQSPHLGLRIVCALAAQLGADLRFDNTELGLSVRLRVPVFDNES